MAIGESIYSGTQGTENRPRSLTLGTVKENWNPMLPGMVKVLIATPNDGEVESDWMPVASPYAGGGVGCYLLPEVGSTVVIGYIDDNSVSPMVLGCTWIKQGEKKNDLPSDTANAKNSVKVFTFTNGTLIRVTEDSQGDLVEVMTGRGQKLILDGQQQKMQLISKQGECEAELDGKTGKVTVEAEQEIALKIGGKECLKLDTSGLTVNVNKVIIKAQSLEGNASQTKLAGSTIELTAQGSLKAESSGVTQIKGSMVKIN